MAVDRDLLVVMNTVDDTRDHMSEGRYLRTCDAIKRVHDKLKRPKIPLPHLTALLKFTASVTVLKILGKILKIEDAS